MKVFTNAMSGTANTAPVMPAMKVPPATPSRTATGCRDTLEPMMSGCSTLDSICWTASTTIRRITAAVRPWSTSATRQAMVPESRAPTIGMKEKRKTTTPIGSQSCTPRKKAPPAIPMASMRATSTWAFT